MKKSKLSKGVKNSVTRINSKTTNSNNELNERYIQLTPDGRYLTRRTYKGVQFSTGIYDTLPEAKAAVKSFDMTYTKLVEKGLLK